LLAALQEEHATRGAEAASSAAFDRLEALATALVGRLRSPLAPKRVHGTLAATLYTALLEQRMALPLLSVLASPTALTEIADFLAVAALFREYGFAAAPHLLAVRWENLVEVEEMSPASRLDAFHTCLDGLFRASDMFGLAAKITPVDIAATADLRAVVAPPDFVQSFCRVADAVHDLANAEASLARNLLWITGFYARQQSLQRLGVVQPLLDLGIRAGIGQRSAVLAGTGPALMLTSELNPRFIHCYEPRLPVANIALMPVGR